MELQFGEVAENKQIFVDTCASFNDRTINSGGNVIDHEALNLVVTPENPGEGILTSAQGYKAFKKVRSYYSNDVLVRYEASGKHDGRDIGLFCNNDPSIIILHAWLEKIGNPELSAAVGEGARLDNGFETALTQNLPTNNNSTPNNAIAVNHAGGGSSSRGSNKRTMNQLLENFQSSANRRLRLATEKLEVERSSTNILNRRNLIATSTNLMNQIREIRNELNKTTLVSVTDHEILEEDLTFLRSQLDEIKDQLASTTTQQTSSSSSVDELL